MTVSNEATATPSVTNGAPHGRTRRIHPLGLVEWAVVIVSLLTFTGFLARLGWLLELTCHFRVQYMLFLAAGAVFIALAKRRKSAAAAATVALINLPSILPLYLGRPAGVDAGRPARVLLWNVSTSNRSHREVIEFLKKADPDVAVLLEIDKTWLDALSSSLVDYPYRCSRARKDNFGLALFSRFPIESGGIETIGDAAVPSIKVRLSVDGTPLTLIGTHPPPPKTPVYAAYRDQQLRAVADIVARERDPVMVLGDLNATPWSPVFKRLLLETNLVDARRGFGLRPTWPSRFPPLWIPIDHCLVSPCAKIRDVWVGPSRGSDHRALVIDFVVPVAGTAR